MATYGLNARRARYFALSSQIAHIDTAQLRSMFEGTETRRGWGRNHTLAIGRSKVFVKRLPVTDLEYEKMFSTKNLYDLPTYYNYGVGSAGFGVFRELVANIKTTNWVLQGKIANFPLLYHYRMIPFCGERPEVDMERHARYVEYWNSNQNISRYMLDRLNANYELVLFLEHLPYPVEPWLLQNLNKTAPVLEDMRAAITFLRKNGIVHFDANFENVLSDGERAYLTDFGLVLDRRFDLTPDEALFLKQNNYYDYGEVFASVGFLLYEIYDALPDEDKRTLMSKYGLVDGMYGAEKMLILLHNIEQIIADGVMRLDKSYIALVIKYRAIIALFVDFFVRMRRNQHKNTTFPHAKLVRLLKESGFLSGSQ